MAGESPWVLAILIGLHLAFGGWLWHSMGDKPPVVPPALVGQLVSPPVVEPVPLPVIEQSKPLPRPVARPRPVVPVPVAPPSERAVSTPLPEPAAPASPEPVAVAPAPPAPPPPPAPLPVVEPLVMPRSDAAHLNNPLPVYPRQSLRLNEEGTVLMSLYILSDGTVGEIRLKRSSGYPRLDQAALETVKRWRFQPARRGNEAISMWYDFPMPFTLER